jgi:two-component system, cell cycle sensor histidine kinase DivJ
MRRCFGGFLRPPSDDPEGDRCSALVRSIADVITHHRRNGEVVFASSAAEPVLGAKPRDLHGCGLFERVHVVDRPAYLKVLGDAAALRQARMVELRVRRDPTQPGSGFAWVEMRCWPLEQAQQTDLPVGTGGEVVALLRDITARKDEEHAIADARAAAEQASVAKSRFIATMSHELRTPLNAIIGFSEMLREEDALMIDAKQRRDYAHLINESGHHLLSVVNGLLDMSKIESGNFELMPEPVEIEKVIDECCELLALRARQAGIEIARELSPDLPRIVADKRALLQIMLNLMSNAIKFSNRGGKVTVAATAELGQPQQAGETAHVAITVEDTGVGIGEQDLERVGEPFFQARSAYDRRHDGTGLGVSIVKGLLALHGGRMEIESHVGKGTRIRVRLPIDCESAGSHSEAVLTLPRAEDARSVPAPDTAPANATETVAGKVVRKSA